MSYHVTEFDVVIRLLVALAVGMVLGYERESQRKPAGLRTYAMVSLGSAAFTLITLAFFEMGREADGTADPMRLIGGLIGGIGFLGAGTIIQQGRNQPHAVRGITTAAGIWVAGALGLACGAGLWYIAAVTVGFAFIVLRVLGKYEHRLIHHRGDDSEGTASRDKS